MARAIEKDGILRKCPVCATPVKDATALGLRNYEWVNQALGNKLGLMDFDGVLTQYKTGRMLVLEFKPPGAYISTGARLAFAMLVQAGYDVWILWEEKDGRVSVGICNDKGRPVTKLLMTVPDAAELVQDWWAMGFAEEE